MDIYILDKCHKHSIARGSGDAIEGVLVYTRYRVIAVPGSWLTVAQGEPGPSYPLDHFGSP